MTTWAILINKTLLLRKFRKKFSLMTKPRSPSKISPSLLLRSTRAILLLTVTLTAGQAVALPRPDDLPEEYLRTQIILEARSPLTGEAMTAADYAELLTSLAQEFNKQENANFAKPYRETLFLLRLRKLLKSVGIPIK
jgi:hypothetical protein